MRRMWSIRFHRSFPTISRNSPSFIRFTRVSCQGLTSALSTEYIHLTPHSIARRQLSIQAARSMCRIFSAATAAGAKEVNWG